MAAPPEVSGRAYVNHLARAGEMLSGMLVTWHNLRFYQDLMAGLRAAIRDGALDVFAESFAARRTKACLEPPQRTRNVTLGCRSVPA